MNPTARTQILTFAFFCAVSILFWWPQLARTLHLALTNDAYTHILLILPLSAALIYLGSKHQDSEYRDSQAPRVESRPIRRIGITLLVVAFLFGCYVRWGMVTTPDDVRLSLAMFALVTWWIAAILFCFGARTFYSFLFPFCFLFLVVPIPEFALNWIVEFLQYQSAVASRIMFRAIGVPATQDGIIVSIPGLDLEIAPECSSIRSSLMLIVTTLVLAHLFLRSWWRKALLVVIAIPLSVAKNGLRIFTIGELGTRVDPAFLSGNLHHHGGIIFFGIAVVVLVALLWILHRTEFPQMRHP